MAQGRVDSAEVELTSARLLAREALELRREAARVCAGEIEDAAYSGLRTRTWLEGAVRRGSSLAPLIGRSAHHGPARPVTGDLGDEGTGEESPPNEEENDAGGMEGDGSWPRESAFPRQHEETIEQAAEEYGVDKVTLTALLIKEGSGRAWWANRVLGPGFLFLPFEANGPYLGRNQTVGIAQMRPDVAQRLLRDNGAEVSERDARVLLTMDDEWAIRLAAAELSHLKEELAITDRQACVAYAGGAGEDVTRAWLDGAPRERAPLMYEREDGAARHHELAEEYWEWAEIEESGAGEGGGDGGGTTGDEGGSGG
ncbi:hypothetical protein EBN88_17810 [Streptomyces triticirhizae]|uniref:Uncharacterized protein n=1 Tax=Streptomyces triticirhizae TaxID=2483353 RepID=A0A3M2LKM9_9ACTN|nr:hypothetical protein EBN88_17810 [Streptomyces triticirhizae]